jgi:L-aminopeptidase/D-esterase-like protein
MTRSGAISGHGSGDIFMAFSTANQDAHQDDERLYRASFIPNARLDSLFEAVIQAVDEAILNAMVANETMHGFQGTVVEALSHERTMEILRAHGV